MKSTAEALFVFSTGRCGTQWLAEVLSRAAGDAAVVTHEPLERDYAARRMLAAGDLALLDEELAEPILEHCQEIAEILETRSYIECGHPSWSSLPYLLRRFAGRVRVIHLVRHPVPTAWSWVTQQAYCAPLVSYPPERVLLSPFDDGTQFTTYRERWPSLTPYEKALFFWAEVQAFGLRLEATSGVPWLRIRFEHLSGGVGLNEILGFAGLPGAGAGEATPERVVDRYSFFASVDVEPTLIREHPDVIEVARQLGYDALDFESDRLRRRYSG